MMMVMSKGKFQNNIRYVTDREISNYKIMMVLKNHIYYATSYSIFTILNNCMNFKLDFSFYIKHTKHKELLQTYRAKIV